MTHPFKMGRKRPLVRQRMLHMRDYLTPALPAAPATVDYTAKCLPFLKEVLGNDTLGDCTCAGAVHIAGAWIANGGAPVPFEASDAVGLYERACGYNPADPSTDQGGDEQTVLNYLKANGIDGKGNDKLDAWARVDGSSGIQVRSALYLFENVYFGVELPDAWVSPMPGADGFVWDVAGPANPDNGHCFVGLGYDAQGVTIDTWGLIGKITWAAIARYATTAGSGELYTLFGADAVDAATSKAPNGFLGTQLAQDIQSLAG